jgi:archaellum biogenesis ATPase FlaH
VTEPKILSTLIASREAYDKLSPHVDGNTFSDLGKEIYKEVLVYYAADANALKADLEIIKSRMEKKYGKQFKIFNEYIESLPEATSLPNLLNLLVEQKKGRLGLEISQALVGNKETRARELIYQYLNLKIEEKKEQDELFNGTPLSELEQHFTGHNLVPIYPSRLNQLLGGGVPRQYQICIFARPNVGKSTVAINIAGGAALNGYKVLYVGNEDPAPKMVYRLVSRVLKKSEEEIKKDLESNYKEALEIGYKNIWFVSLHPGNYKEIRDWVEKVKPDIVIVDQIRNCAFKPESMTINLEQGVIAMRNLAKEFNFVSIVITQAGDSADGKLVLDMNDVEWSNTGVAAQMDLMIGVGQNREFRDQGKVMFSFPKVKYQAPISPFAVTIDYACQRILV